MNERVLIIEDDQAILKLLQRGLAYEGYTVDTATDGRTGLILARDHTPDIVILDWMLPGMDGLEVCHRLRTGGSVPILMLTAKDTVQDRVQGLDAGADDYLVKPFAFEELLARVHALVRRRYEERSPVVDVGGLTVDVVARKATFGGRVLDLTAREYALLEYLALRRGQTVGREAIEDHIYGVNKLPSSNAVDSTICILRAKLGPEGKDLIRTRRGQGYVLDEVRE